MWLKKLCSFFCPPASSDPEWERLRLQIYRRFLKLLMVVLVLAGTRNWMMHLGTVTLEYVVAGLALVALKFLEFRPSARRAVVWAFTVAVFLLIGVAIILWEGPPPAPAIMFVPLLAIVGAVLEGQGLSLVLFGLSLGLVVLGWHQAGGMAAAAPVQQSLGIVLALSLGLYASIVAWERVLGRGLAALQSSKDRLQRSIEERQALSSALFGGLAQALQELRQQLRGVPVDWRSVHAAAGKVRARMEQFRQFRQGLGSENVPAMDDGDFARAVMLNLLWVGLLLSLAGMVDHYFTGAGEAWHGPLSLLLLGSGLWSLRGGRAPGRALRVTVSLMGPLMMGAQVLTQPGQGIPPVIHLWLLSILNTGLMLNFAAAAVVTGLGLFLLLTLWLTPEVVVNAASFHLATDLAACWLFALFIILQAMVWQRDLLARVSERSLAIATSLRLRRRLLGTFFHDLANPLNAVLAAAELGRAGLGRPADAQRTLRLCDRMLELLGPSQDLLLDDVVIPAERLQPVELVSLAAAMHELFADRLTAKPVLLVTEVPAGLGVRAVPSILRDSVLSNLVSNAIKFSPPGAQVELDAWQEGTWVVLGVRDRGPGLPNDAQEALAQGRDLPSRSGSSGETGQGLGLALASEHLQRQGGRLELKDRPGGGTEAQIWLPVA